MNTTETYGCAVCGSELLVTQPPRGSIGQRRWVSPILCCGQPLGHIAPCEDAPSLPGEHHRVGCPQCGYEVRLVVGPAKKLVCWVCQTEFVQMDERSSRKGQMRDRRVGCAAVPRRISPG